MSNSNEKITMLHGAGGTVMHNLVKNYIVKYLGGLGNTAEVPLEAMDDAAVVGDIVFKSDSHAVKPIFFPGGDIGRLSISGTVNDISAMGADALCSGLRLHFGGGLVNFGFGADPLMSMRETCIEAGVGIVTGDTKVVEKGSLGGL
jgi:hydrogenase expression/formation protein HypE